jgi:hypothetical protein
MRLPLLSAALAIAAAAGPQRATEAWEPSPMEAFAQAPGTQTTWSTAIGSLDRSDVHAKVTALELANSATPPKRMRGVKIDLQNLDGADHIYLDEEAIARTIKALGDVSQGMPFGSGRGCHGAAAFTDKYDWPWNKYHELNAQECNFPEESTLWLMGRHKPATYLFPGETPEHLTKLLNQSVDQIGKH